MPDDANKLIMENINKNQVDIDQYPATAVIHSRCISMCACLLLLIVLVVGDEQ